MAEELSAEVVIVGAGIAGSLAAAGLAAKGIDTLVLDAGPRITRGQALRTYYAAPDRGKPTASYPDTAYAPHPRTGEPDGYFVQAGPEPFGTTYLRVVGGTTWHWEGVCLRFVPDDFRMKSAFGLALDWPISYRDLEPWYDAAEAAIGVAGDAAEQPGSPRTTAFPLPPMPRSYLDQAFARALAATPYRLITTPMARNTETYNGRSACCGSGSCVQICPSGAKYDATVHVEAAERAGARVLAEHVVEKLENDAEGRISALVFKRPDGSRGRVKAKVTVLAAHGIETPKILLMSLGDTRPAGLANGSGQVGRNLMDHPYKMSWALTKRPVWPYRGPSSITSVDNTRWGDWRAERPAYRISIPTSGWSWTRRAPGSTLDALIDQGLEGAALAAALRDQLSRQVTLASMTEQLPDPANRIVPDFTKRDAIGIPRPKIHYRHDDYTHRGMAAAQEVHEEIFARLGVSELHHAARPWSGGHVMGTHRMGEDPRDSVVDPDLRAHDHPNLFLLGSGVFPTGAAANPTLTIAALALRAVQPIAETLRS